MACALVSFSLSLFLYPFLLLSSIFIDLYIICLSSSFIILPPYFSPSASVIPLLPFSPFSSSPLHSLLFLLHHLFFRSIPMLFFVPPSLLPFIYFSCPLFLCFTALLLCPLSFLPLLPLPVLFPILLQPSLHLSSTPSSPPFFSFRLYLSCVSTLFICSSSCCSASDYDSLPPRGGAAL